MNYEKILTMALDLRPTTAEIQTSFKEWPCRDEEQMETRMAELLAVRERNQKKFGQIQFVQVNDPSNDKYAIRMWKLADVVH